MFMLGPPLGWDACYKDDLKRQERSFNVLTSGLKNYNEKTELSFMEIIDNVRQGDIT